MKDKFREMTNPSDCINSASSAPPRSAVVPKINLENLQKMVFIYNAVCDGWSVNKKRDNVFEFIKERKIEERDLSNFIEYNTSRDTPEGVTQLPNPDGVSGRAGINSVASPKRGTPRGANIYDGTNSVASPRGGTPRGASSETDTSVGVSGRAGTIVDSSSKGDIENYLINFLKLNSRLDSLVKNKINM